MINNVTTVSTAIRKDLPVWQLTQISLMDNFPDAEINLIVPERDYLEFKKITKNKVRLHVETEILDCRGLQELSQNRKFNWYYQQFLKLYFFKNVKTDYGIIWDADTPLLKRIPIVTDGKIIINAGHGTKHVPYCKTIEHLLGTNAYQEQTFISQFIAFKTDHLKELLSAIESVDKDWLATIICSEDAQKLIFSEYETLATYLLINYPDQYKLTAIKWERCGGKKIKFLKNLSLANLKSIFPNDYYVALESYHILKGLRLVDRMKYRFAIGQINLAEIIKFLRKL